MKNKVILFCLCVVFPLLLTAQGEVSGNFGFNHIASGGGKVTHYTISPQIGFRSTDKHTMGLQIGYSKLGVENNSYSSMDFNVNLFALGFYSRDYLLGNNNVKLLIESSISVGLPMKEANTTVALGALPVVQFKLSEHVFFDFTIGLMGIAYVTVPDIDYQEFSLGLNNTFNLGDLSVLGIASSSIIPLQYGFTYMF